MNPGYMRLYSLCNPESNTMVILKSFRPFIMKKLLASLFILSFCLFSCTEKTLTDQIVPKHENSHYLSLETRSSIKIEELPDGYDFNVTLADAEIVANRYSSDNKLQELVPYGYDGHTLFYVANYDKGYKVISGDKRTSIFLLESDEGRFEFRDDGEFDGPSFWLDDLAYDILLLKKGEAKVTDASNVLFWNSIVGNDDLRIPNQLLIMSDLDSIDFDDPEHVWAIVPVSENDYCYNDSIPHILTTKWGQDDPWNKYVPLKGTGLSIHCPTGCSAVAMAQIIYYCHYNLNKPSWLYEGAHVTGTYNDPNDPIDYNPGTYVANSDHWDDMAINYVSYWLIGLNADYVGQLMADVGHQIGMSYTAAKSSAPMSSNGFAYYGINCNTDDYSSSIVISYLLSYKPVAISAVAHEWDYGIILDRHGHSWVIDGLNQGIRDHVITYEWRRLSELSSNNYPLYTEEQMMFIDPDVYSGKTFQETTRYTQNYYKMNWGHDGYGDNVLYGVNNSDDWVYNNLNYKHNKHIWYDFR